MRNLMHILDKTRVSLRFEPRISARHRDLVCVVRACRGAVTGGQTGGETGGQTGGRGLIDGRSPRRLVKQAGWTLFGR